MTESSKTQTQNPSAVTNILTSLRDILAQLDAAELPADIGAHIDLALCRLEDLEGVTRAANH